MRISVDNPNYPQGEEISISGLAVVPNGESVDLDDDTVAQFEAANEMSIHEFFAMKKSVTVDDGSEQKRYREQKERELEAEVEPQTEGEGESETNFFVDEEGGDDVNA